PGFPRLAFGGSIQIRKGKKPRGARDDFSRPKSPPILPPIHQPRSFLAGTKPGPPEMSPAADSASGSKRQAELLKQEGNTCFKKDRISAAIDAYTGAIALCQNVAVYWTNRALCYKKRNEWAKVEEDCRMAIHYDSHSVKAHYMLGLALLDRQELAGGIKALEKSLELGRGAHPASYMVEEIWQELSKAKYIEWEGLSKMRSSQLHKLKCVSNIFF
uniref:RING-type E3 ubiquitin transferase n=1 Tax=Aegilops tauschii subsp. strangulata TaxID=200361 RepID=A0A453S2G2_AEGTS